MSGQQAGGGSDLCAVLTGLGAAYALTSQGACHFSRKWLAEVVLLRQKRPVPFRGLRTVQVNFVKYAKGVLCRLKNCRRGNCPLRQFSCQTEHVLKPKEFVPVRFGGAEAPLNEHSASASLFSILSMISPVISTGSPPVFT